MDLVWAENALTYCIATLASPMKAQIDPKLERALLSGVGPLNVFAKFRPKVPEEATASAKSLITRVAKKTKESPKFDYRDLDSVLHVSANPRFIEELLRQPEIVSASMVPDLDSALIEPLNPHEVSEAEISHPTYPRRHISSSRRR
jgi:hypothetical protein